MDQFGASPANPQSIMNILGGQTPMHGGGSVLSFGGAGPDSAINHQPHSNFHPNLFGSAGPSSTINAGAQSIHSLGGPGLFYILEILFYMVAF